MAQLHVTVDQKLFLETVYRVLGMLDPDRTTEHGKRDLAIKAELDSLINYLLTSQPNVQQSAYPSSSMRTG